jgi:hypothetical protein
MHYIMYINYRILKGYCICIGPDHYIVGLRIYYNTIRNDSYEIRLDRPERLGLSICYLLLYPYTFIISITKKKQ